MFRRETHCFLAGKNDADIGIRHETQPKLGRSWMAHAAYLKTATGLGVPSLGPRVFDAGADEPGADLAAQIAE